MLRPASTTCAPEIEKPDVTWYRPLMDDLTGAKSHSPNRSAGTVLLTAAEERVLFLQYNYARHRVGELQARDRRSRADRAPCAVLHWDRIACSTREQIAETNLALVLAMAKRTVHERGRFRRPRFRGQHVRAVDKFDCARGFKFSTYARRAIRRFSRQGMKLSKYRQRFPTDFDPALEKSNHLERLTVPRRSARQPTRSSTLS